MTSSAPSDCTSATDSVSRTIDQDALTRLQTRSVAKALERRHSGHVCGCRFLIREPRWFARETIRLRDCELSKTAVRAAEDVVPNPQLADARAHSRDAPGDVDTADRLCRRAQSLSQPDHI